MEQWTLGPTAYVCLCACVTKCVHMCKLMQRELCVQATHEKAHTRGHTYIMWLLAYPRWHVRGTARCMLTCGSCLKPLQKTLSCPAVNIHITSTNMQLYNWKTQEHTHKKRYEGVFVYCSDTLQDLGWWQHWSPTKLTEFVCPSLTLLSPFTSICSAIETYTVSVFLFDLLNIIIFFFRFIHWSAVSFFCFSCKVSRDAT